MSNKSFGLRKEREAKKIMEKEGFLAHRCRGSFGCFDIISHNGKIWKLIQCKSTKQEYASYKKDIEKIKKIEVPENTQKELWIYWSPNRKRKKKGWERMIL